MADSDRQYFDSNFKEVYKRITDSKEELSTRIFDVREELRVHKSTPCRDVLDHEEKKHNPYKTVAILGGIVGIVTGLWEGFKALLGMAKQ